MSDVLKSLSDMFEEFDAETAEMTREAEEELRLFGPIIDPHDKSVYPPGSQAKAEAIVKKNRRDAAIAAHKRGEPWEAVEKILKGDPERQLSQLVTPVGGAKRALLRSQRDYDRQHLRQQLLKARRRAEKLGDMSLVYQPWLDDIEQLYLYAGARPHNEASFQFMTEDTAGPFAPGNVSWMSHDQQLMRLNIRTVEFEGEMITLAEVAKRTGLTAAKIRARYDAGVRGPDLWSGRNLGAVYEVDVAGEKLTLAEVAKAWGIKPTTLRARLKRGLKGMDLVSKEDMRTGSAKRAKRGLSQVVTTTEQKGHDDE